MSQVVETGPCPRSECGSSDAWKLFDDGHAYCFSCETYFPGEGDAGPAKPDKASGLLPRGEFRALSKRKIHEETCRKFGYTVGSLSGKTVQIAPYRKAGQIVGQHVRFPDKDFRWIGESKGVELFGQHLWTGRHPQSRDDRTYRLVITEGEIDTLAYAQATGLRWPVVSIPSGAQRAHKDIAANLEFVESFDDVVFLFDNDEAGRKAALKCADILTPGKARIATLPLKDAGEMLVAGRIKELTTSVYEAKPHRPDGLVNGADLWDAVSQPVTMGKPYPWAGMNRVLYGRRGGTVTTWGAGSGVGKSAVVAEIAYHAAVQNGETIGYIALEENNARSGQRFLGIHLNKPIHLPGFDVSLEERRKAFEETLGTGRFIFYDHWGSVDGDNLLSKMRFMVKGMGCQVIILDHLSIVVSGMDLDGDERRMLDHTMTMLRSFAEETRAELHVVSHLRRPNGDRGHEDGVVPVLAHFRGSHAIVQLSDTVIGLARNQQAEKEEDRNTTEVYVLKNRYAGITGPATSLLYDHDTGRLTEIEAPGDDFNESGGDWTDDDDVSF